MEKYSIGREGEINGRKRENAAEFAIFLSSTTLKRKSLLKRNSMNPTEAKFHDDLEKVASDLDVAVQGGKFSWADVQAKLKAKTSRVTQTTDRYVHENAWTSLAIACGVGVGIGLVLKRD